MAPHRVVLAAALAAAMGTPACARQAAPAPIAMDAPAPGRADAPADPRALFDALEQRLLRSERVHVELTVTSDAVFPSDLAGTLALGPGHAVALVFAGTFGEDAQEIELSASDATMALRAGGADGFRQETPPALREGLLIGLTRMGLLHNMAMLIAGQPPDRTDGTVRDWVQVSGFATGPTAAVEGRSARPVRFDIAVSGQPVGEATLWLDTQTGLPVARDQMVRFPDGEMRVRERYLRFDVAAPPADRATK